VADLLQDPVGGNRRRPRLPPMPGHGPLRPAGTAHVAIERTLDGTTWQDTGATVVPDAAGAFTATVPAAEGATYRAAVAAGTSAVVKPQVAARVPLAVRVARGRHHLAVHVRTGARGAGLYASLETYRRWHFVWRPVSERVRIGRSGRITFQVPVALRSRARVVLYGHRGHAAAALLTSRPVRLSDGRPTFEPIPAPPRDGMHGGHGAPAAPGAATTDTPAPAAGPQAGHPAG